MTTIHDWFRSGDYLVLGHTDLPRNRWGEKGVVIVPPFGFEGSCSYRPLRFLARLLAEEGLPVLRFDLPGTGDSSGGPRDGGLVDAWIGSVGRAADELRAQTGVREVAVVGIRLGAILALAAAARGQEIGDLVLWNPASGGRALVRELSAFARMEALAAGPEAAARPPAANLEAGGFLMTSETRRALEALDFTTLPRMEGRRVLLLGRDEFSLDAKLAGALEAAGCSVEAKPGPGYTAMLAYPHEAVPPDATGRTIAEFLTVGRSAETRGEGWEPAIAASPQGVPAPTVIGAAAESIYSIGEGPDAMFGILCGPASGPPRKGLGVLLLNAGAVRHVGPNRMWVEVARRWAARGIVSLRLDLPGVGESEGCATTGETALYRQEMVSHVERAMKSLRQRFGEMDFTVIGLCSGAFWAFHAAIRHAEIRAAVLLNPRLFFWDPEVDRRRMMRRAASALTSWRDWRKLVHGQVGIDKLKRAARIACDRIRGVRAGGGKPLQIQPKAMAEAWAALERNRSRVTLIFAQGEPLLQEMEEEGQLPPETNPRIRCIRVPVIGHLFAPLGTQKLVHELMDHALDGILQEILSKEACTVPAGRND